MAASFLIGAAFGGGGTGVIISIYVRVDDVLGCVAPTRARPRLWCRSNYSDLYKSLETGLLRLAVVAERCLGLGSVPVPVLCRDLTLSLVYGQPRGAVALHALRCRPLSSFGALLHSSRVMSRSLLNSLFFISTVVDGVPGVFFPEVAKV